VVRPVAIVVDPVQRVRRSVLTWLRRLGFEVHRVRGIAQAVVALSGSERVALVLVSADPPAAEASDLLPLLAEFPAAARAQLVLATRAPMSVFAAALARRGVKVLADPIVRDELGSVARVARELPGAAASADALHGRARWARLRGDAAELSRRATMLVERASALVARVDERRRTERGHPRPDRPESSAR
jgi:CheY-like chemotaxis protein